MSTVPPVEPLDEHAEPAPGPPRWRRRVRAGWLVIVAAGVAATLVERWGEVVDTVEALSPLWVAAAAVAAVAGVGVSAAMWRTFLTGFGTRLPMRASARVFFVSQLSKYVPGSVWALFALMEYGRDYRIAPRVGATSLLVFFGIHLATGVALAAVALPATAAGPWWWAAALVPAVAAMVPAVQRRALAGACRLLRRPAPTRTPDAATMRRALAWSVPMWALFGAHLWLLTLDVGGAVGLPYATGVYAAAWSVGFVFVPAPAGAGVREAVVVTLLLPVMPAGAGLALAVLSRLLFTVADVVWGLVGVIAGVRARAPA